MLLAVCKAILKGHAMLGKMMGIVTAGIFVGAAIVEVTEVWERKKDSRPCPNANGATDATEDDQADATLLSQSTGG
ncbi:MAG: hypothetical protein GY854_24100 [Deltaproteobacteria bacterium]|nr:hypothetical protein [Deltaproteobacteria bacterium]